MYDIGGGHKVPDTELKVKCEFGGETGKVTSRIREKTDELRAQVDFERLPFVDRFREELIEPR